MAPCARPWRFDPTWVTWVKDGEDYITDFDMVLLADDEKRVVVGERKQRMNVRLTAAEHKRTGREWLTYDTTVDISAKPARVRRFVLHLPEAYADREAWTLIARRIGAT